MTVGSLKQAIFDINGSRYEDFGWQQLIMKNSELIKFILFISLNIFFIGT
ncbi:MAG: hypothetical protein ACOCP5_02880 [Halanaerobiaceae bacterium]